MIFKVRFYRAISFPSFFFSDRGKLDLLLALDEWIVLFRATHTANKLGFQFNLHCKRRGNSVAIGVEMKITLGMMNRSLYIPLVALFRCYLRSPLIQIRTQSRPKKKKKRKQFLDIVNNFTSKREIVFTTK